MKMDYMSESEPLNFVLLAEAYDALDPNGNITIKWDIISWTPDGYVAVVYHVQFQQYRQFHLGRIHYQNRLTPKNFTIACAPGPGYNVDQLPNSPYLASVVNGPGKNSLAPLVQCTRHMCPIRVHWHVKLNYKDYWRVKVTITNFNYRMNYSQWNLVAQHPNFNNLTQIFSFNYKPLTPYSSINDTGMLWGVKFYNDFLNQAGPIGNVQSELLFKKDKSTFTFDKGWAFPRRVYFNGDNCVMPPPDAYPHLPNASSRVNFSILTLLMTSLAFLFLYE
ncbi:COBRA-like protein [Tanacetum coccineum]